MEITTSLDQYQFFDTIFDPPNFSLDTMFKGRDQREVWGVEIIYKRSVWVWDRGDRHLFYLLLSPHHVLNIFPFRSLQSK